MFLGLFLGPLGPFQDAGERESWTGGQNCDAFRASAVESVKVLELFTRIFKCLRFIVFNVGSFIYFVLSVVTLTLRPTLNGFSQILPGFGLCLPSSDV